MLVRLQRSRSPHTQLVGVWGVHNLHNFLTVPQMTKQMILCVSSHSIPRYRQEQTYIHGNQFACELSQQHIHNRKTLETKPTPIL